MDVDEDILWLLKRSFHLGLYTLNEAMSQHGVTTAQLGLMRRLAQQPGMSGADLARQMLVTPQGAQLAIAALERRGFVERKPDPNHRRILRAHLTQAGRRVARACLDDARSGYRQFFATLDGDEQRVLRGLLKRLVNDAPDDLEDLTDI